MKNRLLTITFFCLALFIVTPPRFAMAQGNPWGGVWAGDEFVAGQIISGTTAVPAKKEIQLALVLRFGKSWRGFAAGHRDAPRFDWSQSKNVKAVEVGWQAPKRFENNGVYSFGYNGEILFPLTVTLENAGKALNLVGKIDLSICENECVSKQFTVALHIPEGEAKVNLDKPRIDTAFSALPTKGDYVSLKIESVRIKNNQLLFRLYSLSGFSEEDDLYVRCADGEECPLMVKPPAIAVSRSDPHVALFMIPAPSSVTNLKKALKGKTLIVTLLHAEHVIEKEFEL